VPTLDSSVWIGPFGGLLCMAFAAGCVAGWGFAMKLMKDRIGDLKADIARERDECDRRISGLETRVREVEDRYTHGMERQLGQVRVSGYHVLPPKGDL
jgi:hypothetical protein